MPITDLPQPPRKDEPRFDDWLWRLWKFVSDSAGGEAATSHTALSNLNSANYSHLTATQKTDLTDGGTSELHYHAADRSRANHTGTQLAATISDFNAAVAAAVTSAPGSAADADILSTQVFGS